MKKKMFHNAPTETGMQGSIFHLSGHGKCLHCSWLPLAKKHARISAFRKAHIISDTLFSEAEISWLEKRSPGLFWKQDISTDLILMKCHWHVSFFICLSHLPEEHIHRNYFSLRWNQNPNDGSNPFYVNNMLTSILACSKTTHGMCATLLLLP